MGFSCGDLSLYKYDAVALMPSMFGMLVYKLVTSNEAKIALSGRRKPLSRLIRCVLSLNPFAATAA